MRAKFVNEAIKHLTGKSDEEIETSLGKDVMMALKNLKALNIPVQIGTNYYNRNVIELFIPGIEDHQIAYLPYEDQYDGEDWGWGVYDLEDGEMFVEGSPGKWEDVLKFILEKL